jgi:hypothetical protein
MGFIKYIFELIVIIYIVRMVMRFIDSSFSTKPIQAKNNTNSAPQPQFTKPKESPKQSSTTDDYIDFEEIKENK